MSVWWMFMILLGCMLSHATQSRTTCTCNEELDPICTTGKEEVHVLCPNVTAVDLGLSLIKDQEMICNLTCNHENNSLTCWPNCRFEVKLYENKLFGFILYGLNDSSQGIYRCESTVTFPPPLKKIQSDARIHVLVKGNHCKCHKKKSSLEFMWIWIMVVVVLTIYSLTATIIAFVIWVKMRKTDSQSDYMNTIPRAPRDRRRKRGVQNLITRHF